MRTTGKCPRCQDETYERFSTHAYCHSCNYSPDFSIQRRQCGDDLPIPPWAHEAIKQMNKQKSVAALMPLPMNQKPKSKKGSAA
jgi:hypothetical protein